MKIAFICPDYGSQFVGMAKELYDQSRIMQEYFEEASTCLDTNFVKLCFASSEYELNQIAHAYPAIFLVSTALIAMLKEKGIAPSLVAGMGIGELSAAFAANALSMPDGLYFLSKYAHFYQELFTTLQGRSIKVTHVPLETVKKLTDYHHCAIAAVFADHELLVTGPKQSIELVENEIIAANGRCYEWAVEAGLHSSLMHPVLMQLRMYLQKIDFRDTEIPLIASENGTLLTYGKAIQEQIMVQLESTIRWDLVMKELENADLVVEMAPGTALTQLLKKEHRHIKVMSINKPTDVDDLLALIKQHQP